MNLVEYRKSQEIRWFQTKKLCNKYTFNYYNFFFHNISSIKTIIFVVVVVVRNEKQYVVVDSFDVLNYFLINLKCKRYADC